MTQHYRLLDILSDGRFHSGEAIGGHLGVTRAAVWKQLRTLKAMGIAVQSVRGRGYRLAAPLELLREADVRAALGAGSQARLAALEVHSEIDSTNAHLRRLALAGGAGGTACLAERQLAGRGRRGREWVSPFGAHVYLSLLWRFPGGPATLGGLSLAVGVGVLRALRDVGLQDAGLKWPNDILCRGAKLAGVLLEMAGESAGPCHVVVGVGVNVAMPEADGAGIDQPWTDLRSLLDGDVSRNRLAGRLLHHLVDVLLLFESSGLEPFLDEWRRHDLAAGRPVRLLLPGEVITGEARGIDASGALLLDSGSGEARRFDAGEISLRMMP